MTSSTLSALVAILALLAAGGTAAKAQTEPGHGVDERLLEAELHLRRGRDQRALVLLRQVLLERPRDAEALGLAVEVAWNIGLYDEADSWSATWLEVDPGASPRLFRARWLLLRGRTAEGLSVLEPLLPPDDGPVDAAGLRALALAGEIEQRRGDRGAADRQFRRIVRAGQVAVVKDPLALLALAQANAHFGGRQGLRQAESILAREVQPALPGNPEPSLLLSELYRERFHLPGDAVKEAEAALEARPNLARAYLALAEAQSAWMRPGPAEEALQSALSINPRLPEALCLRALAALGDFELDRADRALEAVFAIDPEHPLGLHLLAARHLLAGDGEGARRALGRADRSRPGYAEGRLALAKVLNERRRWDEALHHAQEAAALDPASALAQDHVARYAFFLGREELGRKALQEADRLDVFGHPWRKNMFEVGRWVQKHYTTLRSEHFVHVLDRKDEPRYAYALLPFAEASYALLTAKYRYVPPGLADDPGRILVISFSDHASFSVRTLGFTNLGALGVCFGPLILIDSPSALPPTQNSWARTFHHELAHTITLGLTRGRVPRWLTEGLSTHEETVFEPSWTRAMDRELFEALEGGELIPVAHFDSAFTGPRVGFAYYQAGLYCDFLVSRWGFDRILAVLRRLGAEEGILDALRAETGLDADALDRAFEAYVRERVGGFRLIPRVSPGALRRAESALAAGGTPLDALVTVAWGRYQEGRAADAEALLFRAGEAGLSEHRLQILRAALLERRGRTGEARELRLELARRGLLDADTLVRLGEDAEARGDLPEARRFYKAAHLAFPSDPSGGSPASHLARLARKEGDEARELAWIETHLALAHEDVPARERAIELHRRRGGGAGLVPHLLAEVRIRPGNAEVHRELGRLRLAQGEAPAAVCEFDHAIHLLSTAEAPVRAAAFVERGRARLAAGQAGEALEDAQAALALEPGHRDATALRTEALSRTGHEEKPR
jgi:tetratricopeptide (TPR) repeat protein